MFELIQLVRENKVITALWFIMATAISYAALTWYRGDEELATVRALTTLVQEEEAELRRAQTIVDLHDKHAQQLLKSAEDLSVSLDDVALSPDHRSATIQHILKEWADNRQIIAKTLAIMTSVYFESELLREMQSYCIKDFTESDEFLQRQQELMKSVTSDKVTEDQVNQIRTNVDGQRYGWNAAARGPAIDNVLERARRTHNDHVAAANAQVKMFRVRSKLNVAAWTYMGGFVGAHIGRRFWRRRRE